MRTLIRSNLRRAPELTRLLKFAAECSDNADLVTLTVTTCNQKDLQGRPSFGGLAQRVDGAYLVTVGLNPDTSYPRTVRLNFRTPEMHFTCWQEEFLAVAAHELRHIDQFVVGSHPRGQELEAEVDAETFAKAVLDLYRASGDVRAA